MKYQSVKYGILSIWRFLSLRFRDGSEGLKIMDMFSFLLYLKTQSNTCTFLFVRSSRHVYFYFIWVM
ncbi:hypothetical protein RHMOL_Rhmol05G0155000 [Rhododendron molle]|uniref:Uncharacterized protein n=1 Tax=Rhododendron molle TaxID=49168 RepID=A0ACC0NPJ9_RHOML|nr:hypothetical protein RHMOL_Rhmol05G0155000 [Rhododendron molle]